MFKASVLLAKNNVKFHKHPKGLTILIEVLAEEMMEEKKKQSRKWENIRTIKKKKRASAYSEVFRMSLIISSCSQDLPMEV